MEIDSSFSLLLFIPNHFESFRRKERKTCLTEPRKAMELSDCPCPSCAGQNGLLMIHGRRTIVLLAASHVINQCHRELAAISRSGVCGSQSYLTWPHWFPVKSLYRTGHPKWWPQSTGCSGSDRNGSALLEKPVWEPGLTRKAESSLMATSSANPSPLSPLTAPQVKWILCRVQRSWSRLSFQAALQTLPPQSKLPQTGVAGNRLMLLKATDSSSLSPSSVLNNLAGLLCTWALKNQHHSNYNTQWESVWVNQAFPL